MGVHFSRQVSRVQSNFINNVIMTNQSSCIADTNLQVSGTSIIVKGPVVDSNIGVNNTNTGTDASCLIVSDMESTVVNMVGNITQQTSSTAGGLFGNLGFHFDSNINNTITNEVNNTLNMNQTTCAASDIQSVSDTFVYVGGGVFNSDVGVNISSSQTSASCTMDNYMKTATYNSVQANADQDVSTKKGPIAMLISGVVGLIVLLVILVIGMFVLSFLGFGAYELVNALRGGNKKTAQAGTDMTPDKSGSYSSSVNSTVSQLADQAGELSAVAEI